MTDEERQKLCEWLRNTSRGWSGSSLIEPKMAVAADEIERLQKEQAMHGLNVEIVKSILKTAADEIERLQSILQGYEQGEPVAWRWRWHSDPPNEWNFADNEFHSELMTIEPLYTAPPRPADAEPVAWPDIEAAVKAGLAWRNPAPNAAPSGHSNTKTVTIGPTAPPRPDASADPTGAQND